MGEMADHDRELFGSYEDSESYDERKLKYLTWVWRTHFNKETPATEVTCRKFPELGTIDRNECSREIAILQEQLGYDDDEIDFPVERDFRSDEAISQALPDPDDLVGKKAKVYVGVDPSTINFVRSTFGLVLNAYNEADVAVAMAMQKTKELGESRMSKVDMLRREAERMLEQATRLEGIPEEDTFADGQVIKFKKEWHAADAYLYAAIKVGGFWFTTSQQNRFASGRLTWKSLTDLLDVDADSIEVLDMDSAIPIKEYVAGVQKELDASVPNFQSEVKLDEVSGA